jgi:hypothetical protein
VWVGAGTKKDGPVHEIILVFMVESQEQRAIGTSRQFQDQQEVGGEELQH